MRAGGGKRPLQLHRLAHPLLGEDEGGLVGRRPLEGVLDDDAGVLPRLGGDEREDLGRLGAGGRVPAVHRDSRGDHAAGVRDGVGHDRDPPLPQRILGGCRRGQVRTLDDQLGREPGRELLVDLVLEGRRHEAVTNVQDALDARDGADDRAELEEALRGGVPDGAEALDRDGRAAKLDARQLGGDLGGLRDAEAGDARLVVGDASGLIGAADGESFAALYRAADAALYRVKRRGKSGFALAGSEEVWPWATAADPIRPSGDGLRARRLGTCTLRRPESATGSLPRGPDAPRCRRLDGRP